LVGIFEVGADIEPVSVGEQQRFYQQWLSSLPMSGR
jgi:hypothetical protein